MSPRARARRTTRSVLALAGAAALAAVTLARSGAVYTASTTSAASTAAVAAYSYATAVQGSSPYVWWRLDDTSGTTTADSSGNGLAGTLSRTGLVRGVDGALVGTASTAFRTDGQSGCVVSPAQPASQNPLTFEAWFRSTSDRGGLIVGVGPTVAQATGDATYDRQVYLTAGGQVAFAVRPSGASVITSPGTYTDGAWHVVHASIGGSGQKLYVDGVLVASGSATVGANMAGALHAGCGTIDPTFTGAPAAGYLQADLDEVAVYASQLSAATIAAHAAGAAPRQPYAAAVEASRPWGWWRLGDASGTTLTDASGNGRSGTTAGTSWLESGVVAGNTAATFDGSSGCALVSTTVTNPTTFSLEAWFRTTTTTGGWIAGFSGATAVDATQTSTHDRNVYLTNAGTLVFGTWNGAPATVATSSSYNDGAWHHVVATLSSAGQRLYVDGALAASSATTAAQNVTGRWKIGCNKIGATWPSLPTSSYFAGTIDEVAVYAQALDAQTVLRHFQAASVVPSYAGAVRASSPWLWYRMGATGGLTLVPDASGNGRHGAAMPGGLRRGVPGITGDDTATAFDGASGCVVATAAQANPTTFSVEAWFRTRSTRGGPVIGFVADATPTANGWANHDREVYLTDAGTLVFGTWTGTVVAAVTTAAAYNDGAWHHVVATLSSAGQRLYVDGTLAGSSATTAAEALTSWWKVGCGPFDGNWPSVPSSTYFDGTIDEAAVYTTALDAPAVAAHFRAGAASLAALAEKQGSTPWASWRLGEASGTTLADASGSGHTATVSATGTTAGVTGVFPGDRARSFDGATGCAVADASMSDPETFSVEVWFRTTSTVGGTLAGFSDQTGPVVQPTHRDRLLYLTDSGRVVFGAFTGATLGVSSTATYADGAWHQAVATLGTTGGQRLYVDGVLQASDPNTVAETYVGWWHVGCAQLSSWPLAPSSNFFAGTIDEVAIHTVELDAATIAYRYALVARPGSAYGDTVRARTPTLHWTFDQTSGNATDASGNGVTGTASGSGVTRRQAPAIGTGLAWSFDGSAGCVVSASSFVNPTDYSEELWFRSTTTTGGGLIGFTDSSAAGTAGVSWDRMIYLNDAGRIVLGATASNVVTSPAAYNDGDWHHVVGSVGTRGSRLYVDGALVASSSYGTVVNYTGWWHVGCTKLATWPTVPTSSFVDATIDEVAIHPEQLADDTVRAHYLAGAARRAAPVSAASTIATIAGTGTASDSGDGGAATSATLQQPYELGVDPWGNVYVSEFDTGCRIRKIAPNGIVSAFAGTGVCTSTGDGGAATSATINGAAGLAFAPDGSVYVADGYGARVRKVAPSGIITTVAGTGTNGTTGDGGAATAAQIFSPRGLALDPSGNLYIAGRDSNRVRKVTPAGVISTFIGDGTASSTGDGGQASAATVNFVYGVASGPDGTMYVAEFSGCRVRKVTTAGVVSTIAGNGTCTSTGDGGPATSATLNGPHGIVVDPVGAVYVAERAGNRVRRIDPNGTITTVLGTGTATSSGDGGAAGAATVNEPRGLALDAAGRLLVADGSGHRVRRVG